MTFEQMCDRVIEYFRENEDEFNTASQDVYRENGIHGGDRLYDMDTLDEYLDGYEPVDIINKVNLEEFDTSDSYFYDDGDWLISTNEKDYSWYLESNFVYSLYQYYTSGDLYEDLPSYVEKLFNAYDSDDDDEDEEEDTLDDFSGEDFSDETDKGL